MTRGGRDAVVATAAALISALGLYAVAVSVSGDLVVDGPRGATAVPVGAVVVATGLGGLGAWGLAALASRTRRPRTVLVGLVAVGLALSSVPPVSGAATASTAGWLMGLHVVVAVPLVALAWRRVRGAS